MPSLVGRARCGDALSLCPAAVPAPRLVPSHVEEGAVALKALLLGTPCKGSSGPAGTGLGGGDGGK